MLDARYLAFGPGTQNEEEKSTLLHSVLSDRASGSCISCITARNRFRSDEEV